MYDLLTININKIKNEPRRCPNLSFLRFGKPLMHVCNNNIILVIKLANIKLIKHV